MTKVARINALPYMLVKLHRITTVHHIHIMVPRTFSNSFVPTLPSGEVEDLKGNFGQFTVICRKECPSTKNLSPPNPKSDVTVSME